MKRIAFIVPSAEPGYSGVGDYALAMAKALNLMAYPSSVIAWNANQASITEVELDAIPVLHLPASFSLSLKQAASIKWLEDLKCYVCSLQFSGYGFDRNGMAWRMTHAFKPLLAGRSLHIMFHEIWIGVDEKAILKHRILGSVQKHTIAKMVKTLKPKTIHTSNPIYHHLLKQIHIHAIELPIFSNIPVCDNRLPNDKHAAATSPIIPEQPYAIIFGSIHPNVDWNRAIPYLHELLRRLPRGIQILHVGHSPDQSISKLQKQMSDANLPALICCGRQSAAAISSLFKLATLGLTTNPASTLGKSGSFAAMRAHDLPVLCLAKPWRLRSEPDYVPPLPERCFDLNSPIEQVIEATQVPRRPRPNQVQEVAKQFIQDLA